MKTQEFVVTMTIKDNTDPTLVCEKLETLIDESLDYARQKDSEVYSMDLKLKDVKIKKSVRDEQLSNEEHWSYENEGVLPTREWDWFKELKKINEEGGSRGL